MINSGRSCVFVLLASAGLSMPAFAQVARDTTPGYPIRDQAVISSCVSCHAQDSTGRLTRISYQRKTPEAWEATIRRMVTLNGAQFEPAAARAVLKYLANHQGLAPEELRPGRFEVERRMVEYAYDADRRTEDSCRACHSMGRVITQRRTREEWSLVVAMHRGFYPIVDGQSFRRGGPPAPGGDATHPMDNAIGHLTRTFPLVTPQWTAWSATMRAPRVDGTWLISGDEAGKGKFFGELVIRRAAADDEFETQASYTYVNSGTRVTRSGRSVVYTGYQWRGRSSEQGKEEQWREVMFIEPGWASMSGRWFSGGYDEFGMDVTLTRAGNDVVLGGAFPRALRMGAAAQEVRIYGRNLPSNPAVANIDFGPGVRVERVVSSRPDMLVLSVRADSGAIVGARDLFLAGAALRSAVVVHDSISRIKVAPRAAMARVGGVVFPKQFQQFDAIAYNDGPDRRPDTPDDLELGSVPVTWGLEEYGVTYDDDDLKWVGKIDERGFFTPAEDGPNPRRSGNRNNIGDVWVVATYTPRPGARPMRARAQLVVTVPLYMRWEPWRITN
jgi:quinohemoprotein amine dehydrogenase